MSNKKDLSYYILISLIIGAGLFFLILIFLKALILGLLCGISIYLISFLFLSDKKSKFIHETSRIKDKELRKIINTMFDNIDEISTLSNKIKNNEIKNKVSDILNLSEKIISDIEKDPDKIKYSRQFLSYYLNTALKIIKQYIEISEKNIKDIEVEKVLAKTEKILEIIKNSFEKHLANLIKNDIMNLDVELSVLEKTLKSEGML